MASVIIHMAVGKCIGDIVGKCNKAYFLGTIAPDVNKLVGRTRRESHFEDSALKDGPNIKRFIEKYRSYLTRDFEFGYLIHLYTDKYWIEQFYPTFIGSEHIKLLDGTIIPYAEEKLSRLVYQDYMGVNVSTIEDHALDLSLFYDEFDFPDTVIEEVSSNFRTFLDEMGVIIENSKAKQQYLFNQETVNHFIEECSIYILEKLKEDHILLT